MHFLNPYFLVGLLLMAVPWLMEWLHQRKPPTRNMGSLYLLRLALAHATQTAPRRRGRLLFLRATVLGLIALAFAGPLFSRQKNAAGSGSAVTFLLDDTLSMNAGGAWKQAREVIGDALPTLPGNSEVRLTLAASPPQALAQGLASETEDLVERMAPVQARAGAMDWLAALQQSASELDAQNRGKNLLVIASDFQQADWRFATAPVLANLRRQFAEKGIGLAFLPVGKGPGNNVAVRAIEAAGLLPEAGQPAQIKITLSNHGAQLREGLPVEILLNGQTLERQNLPRIIPGATGTLLVSIPKMEAGYQRIRAVIQDARDDLPEDDSAERVLYIPKTMPVLLVESQNGAGRWLRDALEPFHSADQDHYAVQVIAADALEKTDLSAVSSVILASVDRLTTEMTRKVSEHVRRGGGLWILPGAQADKDSYNESGLLPEALQAMVKNAVVHPTSAGAADHPVFAAFREGLAGRLDRPSITQYWEVKAPAAAPLLLLSNGQALLLEKTLGQGRVILTTIPADESWSNWPRSASFLPLCQRITRYLGTGALPPDNVVSGQAVTWKLPANVHEGTVLARSPLGVDTPLDIKKDLDGLPFVSWKNTRVVGVHELRRAPDQPLLAAVSVHAHASESGSPVLAASDLADLSNQLGAAVIHDAAEFDQWQGSVKGGQDFTPLALGLALGALWLERRWLGTHRNRSPQNLGGSTTP